MTTMGGAGWQFDPATRLLTGDRGSVELSPLAGRLLVALARRPAETVTRGSLIEELWAGNFLVGDPALNRLVSEIRRDVGKAYSGRLIETVQKGGYRLANEPGQPIAPRPALARHPVWPWLGAILVVVIVVTLAAHWLIEGMTGLAWVQQHPN